MIGVRSSYKNLVIPEAQTYLNRNVYNNSLSPETLVFRLDRIQLFILAAIIEQFSMGPSLSHLAVIHRIYSVGILYCGEAMRDSDHRVVSVHRFNRRLDFLF